MNSAVELCKHGIQLELVKGPSLGERHVLGARCVVQRERLEDLADVIVRPEHIGNQLQGMQRHRPSGAIQLDVEVAAGRRDAGVVLVLEIVVSELHSNDHRGQLAPLSDLGEHVAFLVELDLRLGD